MDKEVYYGILMNRVLIVSGIYLFRPICLVEGTLDLTTETTLFVSTENRTFYISTDDELLTKDDVESVAYVISKDELMAYDLNSIENAKEEYFEEIASKAYIGFHVPSDEIIQLVSYDFASSYVKFNHVDLDSDDIESESFEKLESITHDNQSKDFEQVSLSRLKEIVNQNTLENMKKKLEEFYFSIKSLEDDNYVVIPSKEKISSIVNNVQCGDDIIQLFIESFNFLLTINDVDEIKSFLHDIYNAYEELYKRFEDIKSDADDIEAAKDFIVVFTDSYDRMLKMDSLEAIKNEIKKIKTNEEERLLEIAIIYDEKVSKRNSIDTKTIINAEQATDLSKDDQIAVLLEKLNSLVGLKNVKRIVQQLIVYLDYVARTKEIQNLENPNLNMVFKGNPGTGKTTVARILAQLLYKLGYAKTDKFLEITAQDLVAGYVGQTAIKTRKLLDQNKGGVVFLDEAYIMCNQSDSFAEEALVEILKEMELKETIFVFAGYQKEMTDFVEMNPGFKSRIGSVIEFEDYNLDELYQILCAKLKIHNLVLSEESKDMIKEIINRQRKKENFGNGRYINHLFDKIIMNHAQNCKGIEDIQILTTISVDDLYEVEEKGKEKIIGFKI